MKRLLLTALIGILVGIGALQAQDQPINPSFMTTGVFLGETPALRDLPTLTAEEFHQMELKGEQKMLNKKLRERHYPYASTALPQGPDPVWQRTMGEVENARSVSMNFNGQTSPYYPPDANGSIGPNHYMQTINTVYAIYNKTSGSIAAGPAALNTLFNGVTGSNYNDGDPVCLYDEQADRWLVVEFSISGTNDYMLMAVSTTNDPTGTWYAYSFDVADMPDYEKIGIWQDGYYMGTNTSGGNDIYVFQRSAMLTGGSPLAVGFDNPWRPTTIDGFMCVPPVDNDGAFAPAGSPGLFITINDDAIGGGTDQLWIYELAVNWSSPSSSTFTRAQQLNVPAFDSNFGSNWDNIKQPGTTRELDAIPMVVMNVPQYRNFGSYQTLVCCHTVDVDATDHAGVRWYELRKTSGTWTIRQSGTYAPDAHSRWMGSIALNGNGEIGLGYSISSSTVYPGIRYTGQTQAAYAAGNGLMDVAEDIIQNGTSSQTTYNRWGDYAGISVDPVNDHTFWFTSEYGGSRQTKIASFDLTAPPLTAAFSAMPTIVNPGGTVSFSDMSPGGPTSWNWSFPGGTPSSSTSQNPVVTYNTLGTYSVTLQVSNGTGTDSETKTNYITVTDMPTNYCASQGNSSAYEYIGEVHFDDFVNTSGGNGYSDYTNLVVPMAAGGSVSVSLTPVFPSSTYVEYFRIWIDYNKDGDFADGDELAFFYDATSTTVSGTINVPAGVTGTTRMRVSMKWNSPSSYCEVFDYGEVEDYAVSFSAPQPLVPVADFSADNTSVTAGQTVHFTDLSANAPTSWAWTFNGGTPSSSTSQNPSVTYNTAGTYAVSLTATNAVGSDVKTVPGYITVVAPQVYCSSHGNANEEWISSVDLNGQTNTSGSSGSAGYQNFSGFVFTLDPGNSYNVTLVPAFSARSKYEYWKIWIDFNADGDFSDANEEVLAIPNDKNTANGTMSIPSGISVSTRMRVSMCRSVYATACQVFSYGEVEDYTVSIVAPDPQPPVADFTGSPTTVALGGNVQFTDLSTEGPTEWSWSFSGGSPSTSTQQNPTVTYNTLGTFDVSMTASNAIGQDSETKTGYIHVVILPSCTEAVAPADGAAGLSTGTTLQWSAATDATGYILYFGTDNPPTNLENGANLGNNTTYSPSGNLSYSTTYYWRVVPYNTYGTASGCPVWSFTTEASPYGSTELSFTDFESGWGIWTDGGGDCGWYTGSTYSSGGTHAADIQDDSGISSSFYLTNGVDVASPGYTQIDVEFEFISVNLGTGEDFWVQYYNGSNWYTVKSYVRGTDFNNNVFYAAGISILESNYTFPTDMKIRFMCDASSNTDDVYIDNIRITATNNVNPNNYLVTMNAPLEASGNGSQNEGFRVYPNPAYDELNIEVLNNQKAEVFINDMQGRVVYHSIFTDELEDINLDTFKAGMYSVLIITHDNVFRTRFVKR